MHAMLSMIFLLFPSISSAIMSTGIAPENERYPNPTSTYIVGRADKSCGDGYSLSFERCQAATEVLDLGKQPAGVAYKKISFGSCASHRMEVITSSFECDLAARTISNKDTTSKLTSNSGLPEGCFEDRKKNSLWVSTHNSNKGNGASSAGQQICKMHMMIDDPDEPHGCFRKHNMTFFNKNTGIKPPGAGGLTMICSSPVAFTLVKAKHECDDGSGVILGKHLTTLQDCALRCSERSGCSVFSYDRRDNVGYCWYETTNKPGVCANVVGNKDFDLFVLEEPSSSGHFKIPSWKFQEACGLYGNGINQPSTFGLPPCPSVKNPSANKVIAAQPPDQFKRIHSAAGCCRFNGTRVDEVEGVKTPKACEARCWGNPECNYFSHSTTLKRCDFCSTCELTTTGNSVTYTSWEKRNWEKIKGTRCSTVPTNRGYRYNGRSLDGKLLCCPPGYEKYGDGSACKKPESAAVFMSSTKPGDKCDECPWGAYRVSSHRTLAAVDDEAWQCGIPSGVGFSAGTRLCRCSGLPSVHGRKLNCALEWSDQRFAFTARACVSGEFWDHGRCHAIGGWVDHGSLPPAHERFKKNQVGKCNPGYHPRTTRIDTVFKTTCADHRNATSVNGWYLVELMSGEKHLVYCDFQTLSTYMKLSTYRGYSRYVDPPSRQLMSGAFAIAALKNAGNELCWTKDTPEEIGANFFTVGKESSNCMKARISAEPLDQCPSCPACKRIYEPNPVVHRYFTNLVNGLTPKEGDRDWHMEGINAVCKEAMLYFNGVTRTFGEHPNLFYGCSSMGPYGRETSFLAGGKTGSDKDHVGCQAARFIAHNCGDWAFDNAGAVGTRIEGCPPNDEACMERGGSLGGSFWMKSNPTTTRMCVKDHGGVCNHGKLLEPSKARSQDNHCGSCDNGYHLDKRRCLAFAGSCPKGSLLPQSQRTGDNHCGSCEAGHYLANGKCEACPAGSAQAQKGNQRGKASCTPCPEGRYQGTPGAVQCRPWRNCLAGWARRDDLSDHTKVDISCERCTGHSSFNSAKDTSECGAQPSCSPGFGLVGHTEKTKGECQPCLAGFFSSTTDARPCKKIEHPRCPVDATLQTNWVCRCRPGYQDNLAYNGTRGGYDGVCRPFGSVCANGTPLTISFRTADGQCGRCNDGYWLDHGKHFCVAYDRVCPHGTPLPQKNLTDNNQCAACDNGYHLDKRRCLAFAGSCPKGSLLPQSQRTGDNHCGSCEAGHYLANGKCEACPAGSAQAQKGNQRGKASCTPCPEGRYQGTPGAVQCRPWRNCLAGWGRRDDLSDHTKVDISCERCTGHSSFNSAKDTSECGAQPSCSPGFGLFGHTEKTKGECQECPHRTFSSMTDSSPCTTATNPHCPPDATLQQNKMCACNPGHKGDFTWNSTAGGYDGHCEAFKPNCKHGTALAVSQRTADDQCGRCNDGYDRDEHDLLCKPYGGECENGGLCDQWLRRKESQCCSCKKPGFYLLHDLCYPVYTPRCANGVPAKLGEAKSPHDCRSCLKGFVKIKDPASEGMVCVNISTPVTTPSSTLDASRASYAPLTGIDSNPDALPHIFSIDVVGIMFGVIAGIVVLIGVTMAVCFFLALKKNKPEGAVQEDK